MFSIEIAFLLLLCSDRINAFHISSHNIPKRTLALKSRRGVASLLTEQPPFSNENNGEGNDFQAAMSNITASYMESMSMETDKEDEAIQQRLEKRAALTQQQQSSNVFRAQFDLNQGLGLSLSQVRSGRKISDSDLNLDRMTMESMSEEGGEDVSVQYMDWPTVAGRIDADFKGLIVSSVVQGGHAWERGVRAGDVVTAISATLGGALWPTSTLDGIQSALSSRKLTSDKISIEFRRVSKSVVTGSRYQLTLKRPLGIDVRENNDGFVVVTGFSDSAPNLVRHAIQLGDRVVSVDSTFGDSMWPVTTVAGLTSAITSRLPGASVTLQLERPLENMQPSASSGNASVVVNPKSTSESTITASVPVSTAVTSKQPADKNALLKRCRDVLQRYSADGNKGTALASFKNKYEVPAIVADKVVDALASANVALDSMTLSMIMRAYLSCKRPDSALRVFEAAVRFRADASCLAPIESLIGSNGGGFAPNESSLNLYTGSALLQAHAMKGDLYSVSRVLASLEGRSGVLVGGLESAPWPFTGSFGAIQPDARCYNIAISAAAKIGGQEGLEMALALFEGMPDSTSDNEKSRKPFKNVVTYNTVINALANAGRPVAAFRIFDRMRRSGVKPDKFTYTPLIKACMNDGDVEELLYDMRESNIKSDTVTYNTIIRSLCEKKRWTEASKLVTEMESKGVYPDSKTYGTLMTGMLRADKPTACLTLFESACSSSKTSSLTDNVHLYTTAITAASVLGDYDRAVELLSRMTSKGVKPNIKTLTSVTGACIAAQQFGLATELFRKIDNPDGYAMCQGIEALSGNGDIAEAFDLVKRQNDVKSRVMTGKQIMKSYQTILVAAIKFRDFEAAGSIFADLLMKGYIPSKVLMHEMCDALGYNEVRGMVSFALEDDDESTSVFRFMLSVLDRLQARRLPVDSFVYSVTLFLGRTLGGTARQVASLVASAKVTETQQQLFENNVVQPDRTVQSWVELLDDFENYDFGRLEAAKLPQVPVRVAGRDIRRLFQAEREVMASSKTRKSSRKSTQRKSNTPYALASK